MTIRLGARFFIAILYLLLLGPLPSLGQSVPRGFTELPLAIATSTPLLCKHLVTLNDPMTGGGILPEMSVPLGSELDSSNISSSGFGVSASLEKILKLNINVGSTTISNFQLRNLSVDTPNETFHCDLNSGRFVYAAMRGDLFFTVVDHSGGPVTPASLAPEVTASAAAGAQSPSVRAASAPPGGAANLAAASPAAGKTMPDSTSPLPTVSLAPGIAAQASTVSVTCSGGGVSFLQQLCAAIPNINFSSLGIGSQVGVAHGYFAVQLMDPRMSGQPHVFSTKGRWTERTATVGDYQLHLSSLNAGEYQKLGIRLGRQLCIRLQARENGQSSFQGAGMDGVFCPQKSMVSIPSEPSRLDAYHPEDTADTYLPTTLGQQPFAEFSSVDNFNQNILKVLTFKVYPKSSFTFSESNVLQDAAPDISITEIVYIIK